MNRFTLQYLNIDNRIRSFSVDINLHIDENVNSIKKDCKEIKKIINSVNKNCSKNEDKVKTAICIWDQTKEMLINII